MSCTTIVALSTALMVRVGGMDYSIDSTVPKGKRISDMEVDGKKVLANKKYKVAGWASVAKDTQGKPIWDVVSDHLRAMKHVRVKHLDIPKIKNMKGNPRIADELT